jgi:Fur family transcriptional regulator, ferric uptake regulator
MEEKRMRMTKQRRFILDLLSKTHQPKSAEMIHAELPDDSMNLSTVYRTLDAFFIEGLVSKSTMKNTAFYYITHQDHHHYMICLGCQKMYEIDCHLDHIADHVASEHHFKITHHDMTVYGYCSDCQANHIQH